MKLRLLLVAFILTAVPCREGAYRRKETSSSMNSALSLQIASDKNITSGTVVRELLDAVESVAKNKDHGRIQRGL